MTERIRGYGAALLVVAFVAGCDDKPSQPLAPTATALQTAEPAAVGAVRFVIDKASSKADFVMDAPKEKIRGRVPGAMTGEATVDLSDLSKMTLNVDVDISGLELFQRVMGDDGKLEEETKSDLQNEHAREWLEIGESAPDDARKKNSRAQFVARKVDKVSAKDVTKLSGMQRKITGTVTGDFLLHGHKTEQTVDVEVTFSFDGDAPKSVEVRTTQPFRVDLAKHDVRPRTTFGKLAQKSLEQLAPKVAKEAEVSVAFTANLAGDAARARSASSSAAATAK